MKKSEIFLLFTLTSCFVSHSSILGGREEIAQGLSVAKQKQKIALLQKKLKVAEKHQRQAQEEVERLSSEMEKTQLALIQKEVDSYEEQMRKCQSDPQRATYLFQIESSTFFLKERELLHQMIQNGPSPSAFEAQLILDRILRMITELSDNAKK